MNDIFISYAQEDSQWMERLARAFASQGWTVWSDSKIPTGKAFSRVIEEAIAHVKCVVVIWSKQSVDSDWVLAEAREGLERKILVPVLIDKSEPPLRFRIVQTGDLNNSDLSSSCPCFSRVLTDISALVTGNSHPILNTDNGARRKPIPVTLAILASLVFIGAAWCGIAWYQKKQNAILATELTAHAIALNKELMEIDNRSYWWTILQSKGGQRVLERSVLLSVEAMRLSPSPEADSMLRQSLAYLNQPVVSMHHQSKLSKAIYNSAKGLVATVDYENTLRIWNGLLGTKIFEQNHTVPVSSLALSPDGRFVVAGSDDASIRVYAIESAVKASEMAHGEDRIGSLAFSPDGFYLASVGSDKTARIWKPESGDEIAQIALYESGRKVMFSRDGRYLAILEGKLFQPGSGRIVRIVDVKKVQREFSRIERENHISSVAFHPNGTFIATADKNGSIKITKLISGEKTSEFSYGGPYPNILYSPDGRYLAAGGRSLVQIWDLQDEKNTSPAATFTHDDKVFNMSFSSEGNLLATGGLDATVRVWNLTTKKEIARLTYTEKIIAEAFSSDGKLVITASRNGKVDTWELFPKDSVKSACNRLQRNLTPEEWKKYLADSRPYRKTCPELQLLSFIMT